MLSGELVTKAFTEALLHIESDLSYFHENGVAIYTAKGITFELRKVDPKTVRHLTGKISMRLSEVIEGDEALMLLATDSKGMTHGPIYAVTDRELKGLKDQMMLQLAESNGND